MTISMFIILFTLLLSVFLMIVEFFFIPGTTIFGIVGAVCGGTSLYFAFQESTNFGYLSLLIGVILFIIFFMIGRKMMKKSKLNLESEITSKVNTFNEGKVSVGDIGITKTVLKPNGKAIFEDVKIEVFSMGEFIVDQTEIEIIKIEENKIYVKNI